MTVTLSNNSIIDTVLAGNLYSLTGGTGAAGTLKYSFNPAKSFLSGKPAVDGQTAKIMTAAQQNAMIAAMNEWAKVARRRESCGWE
jgi:hypothetical protein